MQRALAYCAVRHATAVLRFYRLLRVSERARAVEPLLVLQVGLCNSVGQIGST